MNENSTKFSDSFKFQDHYSMQKEKYRARLSAQYKKPFFFSDGAKYYIFVLKRLAAPCMV